MSLIIIIVLQMRVISIDVLMSAGVIIALIIFTIIIFIIVAVACMVLRSITWIRFIHL